MASIHPRTGLPKIPSRQKWTIAKPCCKARSASGRKTRGPGPDTLGAIHEDHRNNRHVTKGKETLRNREARDPYFFSCQISPHKDLFWICNFLGASSMLRSSGRDGSRCTNWARIPPPLRRRYPARLSAPTDRVEPSSAVLSELRDQQPRFWLAAARSAR